MDYKDVLEQAKADGIHFVSLQFTDILGTIKSITIPVGRLEEALERGVWFDGSSIQGFARIYESDMVLKPDPVTYRVLPWSVPERRRARMICDLYRPDGAPFAGDPRTVLRRVLERAQEKGYLFNTGPELEFFLFKKDGDFPTQPVPHDVGGYFDFSPRDEAQQVRSDIVLALEAMGMQVEASHHEVAAGQHEIDFLYADALASADNAMTFKYTVKAIAATYGLYATFMPKPIFGVNGSGMHTHQSIFDAQGHNLFYDPDDAYKLSQLAYHFITGYEAPAYICWAQINRSALVRIPHYSPGRESSTRVELRCPDPSCNPYLAFAVMLAAGLDGIEQELAAPPPVNEDVYDFDEDDLRERAIGVLPGTLDEALQELAADQVIRDALGKHVYHAFVRAKRAEWDDYRIRVTEWELARYLEAL
jgi:glutamine synthetase